MKIKSDWQVNWFQEVSIQYCIKIVTCYLKKNIKKIDQIYKHIKGGQKNVISEASCIATGDTIISFYQILLKHRVYNTYYIYSG